MKKTFIAIALSSAFIMALVPTVTLAAPATGLDASTPAAGIDQVKPASSNTSGQGIATLPNPLGSKVTSIPALFYQIVNVLVSVSYVVIAFFLILSGFKFVKAQGNDKELEDAKNTFKYTIIGALIIIGAQTITNVVQSIITSLQK